jgi:hypothetical protein
MAGDDYEIRDERERGAYVVGGKSVFTNPKERRRRGFIYIKKPQTSRRGG